MGACSHRRAIERVSFSLRASLFLPETPMLYKVLVVSLPVALCGAVALWWLKGRKSNNFIQVGYVSALYVYPVKSCKGIKLDKALCLPHGIQHDR